MVNGLKYLPTISLDVDVDYLQSNNLCLGRETHPEHLFIVA